MKRALVVAAFAGAMIFASACGHDWSPFEPSGAGGNGSGGANAGGSANGGASAGGNGSGAHCGDGHLDPGEECDDGNETDHDGCTACKVDCTEPGAFQSKTTHHCYWIVDDQAQWLPAQGKCSGPGRVDAAALSSKGELAFVAPHLTDTAWLSGHWSFGVMNWAWTNGEPWTFGDDQTGSAAPPWSGPHTDGHHSLLCVVADTNGEIDARSCFEDHPVVCERTPTIANP